MIIQELLGGKLSLAEVESIKCREDFKINEIARLEKPNSEFVFFPISEPAYFITYTNIEVKDNPVLLGNHYHKHKSEYLYLAKGGLVGIFMDIVSGESLLKRCEVCSLIHIMPECAHVFLIKVSTILLEYSPSKLIEWDDYAMTIAQNISDFDLE